MEKDEIKNEITPEGKKLVEDFVNFFINIWTYKQQ